MSAVPLRLADAEPSPEPAGPEAQALETPNADAERGVSHGPLDPQKALGIAGLGFAPVYNEMDNKQRHNEIKWAFMCMSIGLQALTGITTGCFAWFVALCSELLGEVRLHATMHALAEHGPALAWLVSFSLMVCLALAGALPVIFWVKSAGSSGIPAIIGMLNGCDLQREFGWQALLVRLAGVVCAVASGLAAGPEGPMIFIGACTGALLSKIPSHKAVTRYLGRPPSSINEHVYLRDYISTGAACGIAAAFRAPIAGTIFVIEEASSHFRREHLAKMFFGSVTSAVVASYLAGADRNVTPLFEYAVATGSGCRTWLWLKGEFFIIFTVIGVLCGVAGALFNHINVSVAKARARHANGSMPLRRTLEIVVVCLVTSGCWMVLVVLVQGQTVDMHSIFNNGMSCIRDSWRYQIIPAAVVQGVGVDSSLKYQPAPCLYGVQYDSVLCPMAHSLASSRDTGSDYARTCTQHLVQGTGIERRSDVTSFCCNFSTLERLAQGQFQVPANASCSMNLGDSFPKLQGHDAARGTSGADDERNPMAALNLVPLEKAAQNLFARGAPHIISPTALLLFLPVFFLLAAFTAGSAIPSGLLLPMIVIGALIGRLTVLASISLQLSLGWYWQETPESSVLASEWQPFFHYAGGPLPDDVPFSTTGFLDPGVGALVGAAAFLSGTSRISLMITVMMVEITGDPTMIAPVGLATLVAMVVGNRFNHGLYHSLIDVASYPYLPDRWPKAMPKALRLEHVLAQSGRRGVISVSLVAVRSEVASMLNENDYSCFPVVNGDGVLVGLATRKNLQHLLEDASCSVEGASTIPTATNYAIDVGKVTDVNYVTTRASLPLEVTYNLFKRMEISHMVVVDDNHRPLAMLTRGTLLPWCIEEQLGHRRLTRVRGTIQRPRALRTLRSTQASTAESLTDTFNGSTLPNVAASSRVLERAASA